MTDYVCVIGHGGSPEGMSLGATIDGAHAVIRMHDWHWQVKRPEDYGVRCDFMCVPGPWFERAAREMQTRPERGYLCYVLADQRRHKRYPKQLHGLPVEVFNWAIDGAFRGLRPFVPTRGACALLMAALRFPATQIIAVGFDSLIEGRQKPYAEACPSGKDAAYAELIGKRTNSRHDFEAERHAIVDCLASSGRKLTWLVTRDEAA